MTIIIGKGEIRPRSSINTILNGRHKAAIVIHDTNSDSSIYRFECQRNLYTIGLYFSIIFENWHHDSAAL